MSTDFARSRAAFLATIALALGAESAIGKDVKLSLTGSEETPPVTTSASATGTLKVGKDKSVSGVIKTSADRWYCRAHPRRSARSEWPSNHYLDQGC